MRTAAIIFEGGPEPENELQECLMGLRHAVTLDTVAKFRAAGLDQVVLATNYPALAAAAERLGAGVFDTRGSAPFHFGRSLQRAVRASGADAVIYLSGAALPLIEQHEIAWIRQALLQGGPTVVVNNVQSVDLVAWYPASYLERVEPPENDNLLGWLLQEAGMERVLIPHSAAIHFDLDTPTDYLILALSGRGGPRAQAALRAVSWPGDRLRAAADILATELPEVALIGRVGSAIMEHFNRNLPVRLRVFSEERGMKALGREARGEVRSLVADMVADLGPERFFDRMGDVCSAVFFDTRVLFTDRGRRVSEWDRFHSDLGMVERIGDPFVRAFTRAAVNCRIPVVLGGHSVVAGGLWLLADRAIAMREETAGA
ncbi:CTP:molybdopterin cytidylyltransferase MocA [Symbiobacterium terraclitae]|uniref:CTP:molybdopterin cytidylyltransferase MocA n=1 Tax=Symbiobacterium terraclitae TaxID=557451 RepID=A0ABS4JW97_9FIRM|nr:CTP:molybdopterin cytidylyltransferase MocA [Symbiobacterium terraclitae]